MESKKATRKYAAHKLGHTQDTQDHNVGDRPFKAQEPTRPAKFMVEAPRVYDALNGRSPTL